MKLLLKNNGVVEVTIDCSRIHSFGLIAPSIKIVHGSGAPSILSGMQSILEPEPESSNGWVYSGTGDKVYQAFEILP